MLVWDFCIGWATVLDAPRLVTTALMGLPYQWSEFPITQMAGQNFLLGPGSLLKSTLSSLHFPCSDTFLEAPSDQNSFCWCFMYHPNLSLLSNTPAARQVAVQYCHMVRRHNISNYTLIIIYETATISTQLCTLSASPSISIHLWHHIFSCFPRSYSFTPLYSLLASYAVTLVVIRFLPAIRTDIDRHGCHKSVRCIILIRPAIQEVQRWNWSWRTCIATYLDFWNGLVRTYNWKL